MMNSLETLYQRLDEAECAYHRLMTGASEVTVSVGGFGATTYDQIDSEKLRQYILQIKCDITARERRVRRGPIFIRF